MERGAEPEATAFVLAVCNAQPPHSHHLGAMSGELSCLYTINVA